MTRTGGIRSRVCALAAGITLVGLGACSSTPPPSEQIAAADLAVREADESEAGTHAPAHLRRARDKLEQARSAMQTENHEQARRLAEQALVDAQLAQAEARAEIADEQLLEMQRSIEDLRRESTRQR